MKPGNFGAAQIPSDDAGVGQTFTNALGQKCIMLYCASGFTQYQPYVVDQGATGPIAGAPATLAVNACKVAVPQGTTTTTAGWYEFVVGGQCEALVDGTTDVAAGAFLEVLNAGTALVLDHATAATEGAVGFAIDAVTADAATQATVYLLDRFAQVAAA